MFTLKQIEEVHNKGKGLSEFARNLKVLGVKYYVTYISDGHSDYFGKDKYLVTSMAVHETFEVSIQSNKEKFLKSLTRHEEDKTDYITFSKELANAGIETWVVNMQEMTISFYNKIGEKVLIEAIS